MTIVGTYYDAGVSGSDPITERSGFNSIFWDALKNGVETILVESPDRFARDLIVQLLGHSLLKEKGIQLIPTTAPDFFTHDTPTAIMVRQILGAVAQFEKVSTVAKLKAARDRRSKHLGHRAESRRADSKAVAAAGQSLARKLSRQLSEQGFNSPGGKPYSTSSIKWIRKRAPHEVRTDCN